MTVDEYVQKVGTLDVVVLQLVVDLCLFVFI